MLKEYFARYRLKDIFFVISLLIIVVVVFYFFLSVYISHRMSNMLEKNIELSEMIKRFSKFHLQFSIIELNTYSFLHRHTISDLGALKEDLMQVKLEFNDFLSEAKTRELFNDIDSMDIISRQIETIYGIIEGIEGYPVSSRDTKELYDAFFVSRLVFERLESSLEEISRDNVNNIRWTFRMNKYYLIPLIFVIIFLSMVLFYQKRIVNKKIEDLNQFILSCEIGKTSEKKEYPYRDEFVSVVETYKKIIKTAKQYIFEVEYLRSYLMNIIDSMPSMLISLDNNGTITQVNKCTEKSLGFSRHDLLGKNFWSLDTPFRRYKKDCNEIIQSRLDSKIYKSNYFYDRYWDVHLFPIMSNEILGIVIRADDITEKEKIEQSLRRAQQMELIGTMAGGLAHDFNNTLSGIIGTLSLIRFKIKKGLMREVDDKEFGNYLDIMQNSADNASRIVKRLLALSEQQDTEFTKVDLIRCISNVISICRNSFEKIISINVHADYENAFIQGDSTQVEQVLLNIAVNGCHSMTIQRESGKEGGDLDFRMESVFSDESFCLKHPKAQKGHYWKVSVTDTGVGMDQATLGKIFTPFFTRKNKENGIGLGLSMVYSIVSKHNGFIEVSSKTGKGTRFELYFPADTASGDQEEETGARSVSYGKGKILVIDDDESIRHIARDMLRECGYEVILAENGIEGIELYKEQKGTIDLVLMDVIMPEKSGKETYIELKELDKDIKVIVISGFRKDKRAEFLLEDGCFSFLQKPFSFHELADEVSRAINAS